MKVKQSTFLPSLNLLFSPILRDFIIISKWDFYTGIHLPLFPWICHPAAHFYGVLLMQNIIWNIYRALFFKILLCTPEIPITYIEEKILSAVPRSLFFSFSNGHIHIAGVSSPE